MPVLELERLSEEDATKYAGQWVAVKAGKVLVASHDPLEVVRWVQEHHASPDLVFAVPGETEPSNWSL